MSDPDLQLIDEIYSRALELEADEQANFIMEQCAGNDELERRVLALVAAARASDDSIRSRFDTVRDRLMRDIFDGGSESGENLSGQVIGRWRLEKRVARGGLATVYLAQRADGAYEQRAAFKVLRRGLDTDDLVSRFHAERQILSALDHPSIAQILDGGAMPDGRPFLVLDFVDGEVIRDYCAERSISIRDKVRLVIDVLSALQHAHARLVVHRDVKPSNIMVSADGRVTLLDFGIAKLLDPGSLPGASTMTRTGVTLLTPGYASPEQVSGEPVTTASDIYQAGAVLYELLAGSPPKIGKDRTGEFSPFALGKQVPGDLVAIIGKAMRDEPGERYASAAGMAADLSNFLEGLPVAAHAPSLRYRLGKLVRRRPWVAPAAIVAVLALAGYVTTLTIYTRQLQLEQQRTSTAQEFLVGLFGSADPFRPADPEFGRDIAVVDALDLGVARLESGSLDDPELKASLLHTIAGVYASLDQNQRAIELGEQALILRDELHGRVSEPVLETIAMLADQFAAISDLERAENYFEQQLSIASQLHPGDSAATGVAESRLGRFRNTQGRTDDAIALLESGIEQMREADTPQPEPLLQALLSLAIIRAENRDERAMELLQEARRLVGLHFERDSVQAAAVHTHTGTVLSAFRDYEGAVTSFLAAQAVYESRIGAEHQAAIGSLNNLAIAYGRMGDPQRSEEVHRELLARLLAKHGPDHLATAGSYQNTATMVGRQGRYGEAIPLHRKALESYEAVLAGSHFLKAFPLLSIAYAQLNLGEFAESEAAARRAHAMLIDTAPDSYIVGVSQCLVGLALEGQGRTSQGDTMLAEARRRLQGSEVLDPYRSLCLAAE